MPHRINLNFYSMDFFTLDFLNIGEKLFHFQEEVILLTETFFYYTDFGRHYSLEWQLVLTKLKIVRDIANWHRLSPYSVLVSAYFPSSFCPYCGYVHSGCSSQHHYFWLSTHLAVCSFTCVDDSCMQYAGVVIQNNLTI